ncbi:hypothetical protein CsatB_030680 [Cannabis sativa]
MGFCFESSVVQPKVGEIEWRDDQLTMAFKTFDTDNDRKLSKRELKEAFKYLGSHCSRFRGARALKYADQDNDGFVDLSNSELSKLVTYANNCGYKVV